MIPRATPHIRLGLFGLVLALTALPTEGLTSEPAVPEPRTGWFETSLPAFSPYADQGEIARRMFHLSVTQQLFAHARELGQELQGQSLDPGKENFHVFVPKDYEATKSYGLFVWVSAREKVTVPRKWQNVFSEHDLIFIAVDKAGNRTNDLDRRVPLALHSVMNMQREHRIDPERIYVAGLSGGGRVASKIAAAYGDLFSGGYFIVGSDPMGSKTVPIPDAQVLQRMRSRGRYVFLTGRNDTPTIAATRTALSSYQRLCVFNSILHFPSMGHGLPSIMWFRKAITYLESGYLEEPEEEESNTQCRAGLELEMQQSVIEIDRLITAAETNRATEQLQKFQLRFGRLAEDEFNGLYTRLVKVANGQRPHATSGSTW